MAPPLSADRLLRALRAEGCKVVEHKNWRTHNRNHKGAWGPVNGVMIHHTVTSGTASSVELCYNGHSSLPGPLCHGVIAKDGTIYLVSAGRANHAGSGDDDVLAAVIDERNLPADNEANTDGNSRFYGFECINRGDGDDPWPAAQLEAIEKASAAICRAHGWNQRSVIGHLEWQPGKVDPRGFTMASMRARVAERLKYPAGKFPAPQRAGIVPKSRESAATVQGQAVRALAAWPFIRDIERARGLPEGLLLAVGSRETNLTNKVGDHGHGHGVWQQDDRWWPNMPADFDQDVERQASKAADMLADNHEALKDWPAAVAAYNAGLTGVRDAIAAGKSPDSATTGGDYAADVLGRLAHIKTTPTPTEEDPLAGMSSKDIADAVLNTDGVFGIPEAWRKANPTNKEWKFSAVVVHLGDAIKRTEARVEAQSATIAELARAVAAQGQVDPDDLVRRIEAALEKVTVRLDVAEEGS